MAGYVRQDTSNNIANGSVVDADDLDNEFDALAGAFSASTGHKHDGTTAEGAPITVVGPAQDYIGGASDFSPKTDSTYDLGKVGAAWKDIYGNLTGNADSATTLTGLTASIPELNQLDGNAFVSSTTLDVNSSSAALRITQTGSGNALVVEDSISPDSSPFVITGTGRLGISTDDPQAYVHINSTSVDKVRLQSPSGVGGGFISWADSLDNRKAYVGTSSNISDEFVIWVEDANPIKLGTNNIERIRIDPTGDVGIGTSSPLNRLDIKGGHVSTGENNYGITINSYEPAITLLDRSVGAGSSQILGLSNGGLLIRGDTTNDGTIGHDANTTDFELAKFEPNLTRFVTAGTERMRIDASGNVGIGTSSPTGTLQVSSTFPTLNFDEINADTGYRQTQLSMEDGSFRIQTRDSTNTFVSNDYLIDKDAAGASRHTWRVGNTDSMRIASTGNVGIGTISPTQKLDVNGNIAVTGNVDGRDVSVDGTKLDTIETNADVTDTANVTAAGALMDSEVSSLSGIKTLTVPDNTTVSSFGATIVNDVNAAAALTTLGITATAAELNQLDGNAFVGNITVTGTVDGRDVAADGTKLDGIEAGATADQTAGEIKTAYESNANTNAFTDAEQTKLAGIETGATADQTITAGTGLTGGGTGDVTLNGVTQDTSTWEAGTGTTESLVSPAKMKAAVKPALNATGSAPVYACRAWVNFNGTGTVSIRASGNVSSITDNGTGDYTVNFTTNMQDEDFAAVVTKSRTLRSWISADEHAIGSVRVFMGRTDDSSTRTDDDLVSVAIFR